jgi:hypothetical protein
MPASSPAFWPQTTQLKVKAYRIEYNQDSADLTAGPSSLTGFLLISNATAPWFRDKSRARRITKRTIDWS